MADRLPLDTFFDQEWQRFVRGFRGLFPNSPIPDRPASWSPGRRPDEPGTVRIPGWDDVIHIAPRYNPTQAERDEYYAARRERRQPNLSPDARLELDRRGALRDAIRTSAQPGWAQAFGQIMTAIDNVQDFAATVSMLGRAGVWGSAWIIDHLAPGASRALATALAQQAYRTSLATITAELAALGIRDAAFAQAFAAAASRQAFRTALLGLGTRLALRAVPVLGWLLLAADILNMFNLLGTAAMPLYGFLCQGPAQALAAGIPGVVTKNILCRRVWTNATVNPFSRRAQLKRQLRSMSGIPTIANLIELAQVTDNFWGVGLSIGGLYGALMELLFGAAASGGALPAIAGAPQAVDRAARGIQADFRSRPQREQMVIRQAGQALTSGMILQSVADELPAELHMLTAVTTVAALSPVHNLLRAHDLDELSAHVLGGVWLAPLVPSDKTRALMADIPEHERGFDRWPMPGAPIAATGAEVIEYFTGAIAGSLRTFLEPRRTGIEGCFYGACVTQATEGLWNLIAGDDSSIRYELTPDYKILTGMAVDGLLVPPNTDEGAVLTFWNAMRAELDRNGGKLLEAEQVQAFAKNAGVTLVKMLEPDAVFPPEWSAWVAELERSEPRN